MTEEKRKIILKTDEPEQSFWFGEAVTAKPGEALEVSEKVARFAIDSGKFEYTPETIEQAEAQVDATKGKLPEDFPMQEKLAEAEIFTFEDVNKASDEQILEINGIGEKTLKEIREAAAKIGGSK